MGICLKRKEMIYENGNKSKSYQGQRKWKGN